MTPFPRDNRRDFDKMLGARVLNWIEKQGSWYDADGNFRWHSIFEPTSDPNANRHVFLAILDKARELNYEIQQSKDANGWYHINGVHPLSKRLLVVDRSFDMAVCRFAAMLFGFTPPHPYEVQPDFKNP